MKPSHFFLNKLKFFSKDHYNYYLLGTLIGKNASTIKDG